MARSLTQAITNRISAQDLKTSFTFEINDVEYSDYLISWNISANRTFGANNGIFILNNNDGRFGSSGTDEIEVGDVVELIEQFTGDDILWKSFYGIVNQRSIGKLASNRTITLNCLDYIGVLQALDLDLEVEGTRVEVVDEVLDPVYLAAPNDDLAQLFNFANDSIATHPIPLIRFRDLNHTDNIDTQFDGFEIYYDTGQMKLGSPLQVRNNYEVLSTYYYYTHGKNAEDILEEIIIKVDGYNGYLFGETTAQNVVDNHLTTTFNAEEGTSTDTLIPNLATTTITIETTLTSDISAGATSISLTDATGFPNTGIGEINGDIFTWSGKSGNNLTGIPATGSNALKAHNSGDYVEYEDDYSAGQVWAFSYDNIITTLTNSDFTIPGASLQYLDKKYGRIILDSAIGVGETVTCNTNYSFYTLQATGIELNRMTFRPRELKNRFAALGQVKQYLAPNYIIRTQGDNKIWASYLSQKTIADYTLELVQGATYLEDEDLYTRVLMWAKNKNPTNLMFGDDVDYTSDEEDDYTGTATQEELSYFGEEKSGELSEWATNVLAEAELLHQTPTQELINFIKEKYIDKDHTDQESTGYYVFGTTISDRGRIILGEVIPIVYVNGVPIDNKAHKQTAVPVKIKVSTTTITEGGGKSKSVSVTTYYYYSFILPHGSIDPSQPIYAYDNQGLLRYTVNANDPNMDYADGIYTLPGTEQNEIAESIATASYWVIYSTDKLKIEYDDVIFKIHRSILPEPKTVTIRGTFEYWAIAIAIRDINHLVDGRRDTQLQIEFFGEPPTGFHLGTVDLGTIRTIQAIDIVGGFFRPDEHRKFDVGFRMTVEYSINGTDFYAISDTTDNFEVSGGEAISFEEEDLGTGFEARYLKFTLQEVDRISYGRGRYVVALTEISVYDDIVIESEAKLIATTALNGALSGGEATITVDSTAEFDSSGTAYLNAGGSSGNTDDAFTYTGKTSITFTGCSGVQAQSDDVRVAQTLETDTTLYDDDGLLLQLGDRVYKKILISDRNLYVQSELDTITKAYQKEFKKNHTKIQINIVYAPYLKIGQTIELTDSYNNISSVNYFIESIQNRSGFYSLVLARYP